MLQVLGADCSPGRARWFQYSVIKGKGSVLIDRFRKEKCNESLLIMKRNVPEAPQ